jgi:hypothetical protein
VLGDDDASPVLVTVASRALVRRLGPTAWAVLEDVVLDARPQNGRWLAKTSSRRMAEHLGLTPGTVGRALARLCTEGILRREDRRDSGTGRFGESVYVVAQLVGLRPCVDLPLTADRDTASPRPAAQQTKDRHREPAENDKRRSSAPSRRQAPVTEQQLLLADEAPVTTTSIPVNLPIPRTTKPQTTNDQIPRTQTPRTQNPKPQTNYKAQDLNTTNQRSTDSCQPSGQAFPGASAFRPETGA